jgi:hypothetical protein
VNIQLQRISHRPFRQWVVALVCVATAVALLPGARAQSSYYDRVLFDNSLTPDRYFYAEAEVQAPSTVETTGDRLPVDHEHFHTPPNALRLHWVSKDGGGWQAHIRVNVWRNRVLHFTGDTLTFWCYEPEPLAAPNLPKVVLRDAGRSLRDPVVLAPNLTLSDEDRNFTEPLDLAPYFSILRAGKWTRVSIPMRAFHSSTVRVLDPQKVAAVVFSQGKADGLDHTLLNDDISNEDRRRLARTPLPAVQDVTATGYERHIDVAWKPLTSPEVRHYVIYRSLDGGAFEPVGIQVPGVRRFEDFLGAAGVRAAYKVAAVDRGFHQGPFSAPASAATHPMTDDELLTMVQQASFRYYWEGASPVSGMARENIPGNDSIVATGASGFGAMALVVGVDRGSSPASRAPSVCCGSPDSWSARTGSTGPGHTSWMAAQARLFRCSVRMTMAPIWWKPPS